MEKRKVIIVGESNLCRSFMAETILRGILQRRNIKDIEVISRGLVVLFAEPVAPNALEILLTHGYPVSDFRSSQLTEEDIASSDLILTMSQGQKEYVKEHFETPITCMFAGTLIDQTEDIPEVEGNTKEDYEVCFRAIEHLMEAVADRLIGELLS